jgi:hypothetical protein
VSHRDQPGWLSSSWRHKQLAAGGLGANETSWGTPHIIDPSSIHQASEHSTTHTHPRGGEPKTPTSKKRGTRAAEPRKKDGDNDKIRDPAHYDRTRRRGCVGGGGDVLCMQEMVRDNNNTWQFKSLTVSWFENRELLASCKSLSVLNSSDWAPPNRAVSQIHPLPLSLHTRLDGHLVGPGMIIYESIAAVLTSWFVFPHSQLHALDLRDTPASFINRKDIHANVHGLRLYVCI